MHTIMRLNMLLIDSVFPSPNAARHWVFGFPAGEVAGSPQLRMPEIRFLTRLFRRLIPELWMDQSFHRIISMLHERHPCPNFLRWESSLPGTPSANSSPNGFIVAIHRSKPDCACAISSTS